MALAIARTNDLSLETGLIVPKQAIIAEWRAPAVRFIFGDGLVLDFSAGWADLTIPGVI